MAITRGPSIIRDGLVLCLDAKDPNSYSGSGSTWSDLTTNQQNGTLSGPTYNSSGYFDFDGTNDNVGPNTFDYDDSGGEFTVCTWLNPDTFTSSNSYLAIINRTDNSNHVFSIFIESSSGSGTTGEMSAWFFDTGGTIRQHKSNGNCVLNLNEWNFCVWRFADLDGYTFDLNNSDGSVSYNAPSAYSIRKDSTSEFTIGRWRNAVYYFNGQMAYINLYSKKLSNSEVSQMYNSSRSRFNL